MSSDLNLPPRPAVLTYTVTGCAPLPAMVILSLHDAKKMKTCHTIKPEFVHKLQTLYLPGEWHGGRQPQRLIGPQSAAAAVILHTQ